MYIVQGVLILECLDAIKVGTAVNIIKTIYHARRAPLAKLIKGYILIPFFQNKYLSRNTGSAAHTALDKSPVQLSATDELTPPIQAVTTLAGLDLDKLHKFSIDTMPPLRTAVLRHIVYGCSAGAKNLW